MPDRSRRSFLRAMGSATLCATGVGRGVAAGKTRSKSNGAARDWPTFAGDAANTGQHPTGPGPVGDTSVTWDLSTPAEIASAPTVADGILYAAEYTTRGTEAGIGAYDVATRSEQWRHTLDRGAADCAPTVVDGSVLVATTDRPALLRSLSVDDGAIEWETKIEGQVLSSTTVGNETVFVESTVREVVCGYRVLTKRLVALDVVTGERKWRQSVTGHASNPYLAPAVADGLVVHNTDGGIYVHDATDGTHVRTIAPTLNFVGAPTVLGGVVYGVSFSGNLVAADLDSGDTLWRREIDQSFNSGFSSRSGDLVVATRNGDVWSLSADDGSTNWTTSVGPADYRPVTTPARIFVSTGKRVIALSATTGSEKWALELDAEITAPAALDDRSLYVPTREGVAVVGN
ncbi:PQQ-binding-like beta-propeller repeat protein [Haloarculaceae archaeon H-GB2-1]|nr:PQQ-binding-like beta-propeller repeat protein [Haloarculaceae archaeon H-GB1-1]MEA5408401.1 PQQ-binding-like beta-propeller repeat protein [Haloarculaceae archaeon H-GB2-1]